MTMSSGVQWVMGPYHKVNICANETLYNNTAMFLSYTGSCIANEMKMLCGRDTLTCVVHFLDCLLIVYPPTITALQDQPLSTFQLNLSRFAVELRRCNHPTHPITYHQVE